MWVPGLPVSKKEKKKKLEAKPRRIRTRTSMSAYDHI